MIVKYLGHAFFTITLENGTTIAIDPYGSFFQFPQRNVRADVCLISHHHHDHDGISCLQPGAQLIDQPGVYDLACGVRVRAVATCHDEQGGALRGPNNFFIIEAEGLRIAHAGDLGHALTAEQCKQIGRPDVLMIPVGGTYTVTAEGALQVCAQLQPTMTIPMHYRCRYDEDMNITDLPNFLALCGAKDEQAPLLRLTAGDMAERPQVMTMQICE